MNNWRAVGVTYYGDQHLLYMGTSVEQVKKNYPGSFYELLTTGEQMSINRISLEKWNGKPDCGYWNAQDTLRVPRVNRHASLENFNDAS
jgi:hypothetical protein